MIVIANTQKELKFNQLPINSRWRIDYHPEDMETQELTENNQAFGSNVQDKVIFFFFLFLVIFRSKTHFPSLGQVGLQLRTKELRVLLRRLLKNRIKRELQKVKKTIT